MEKLDNLIASGKLKESIQFLKTHVERNTQTDLLDAVKLLEYQHTQLQSDVAAQLISKEDKEVKESQMNKRLLQLARMSEQGDVLINNNPELSEKTTVQSIMKQIKQLDAQESNHWTPPLSYLLMLCFAVTFFVVVFKLRFVDLMKVSFTDNILNSFFTLAVITIFIYCIVLLCKAAFKSIK